MHLRLFLSALALRTLRHRGLALRRNAREQLHLPLARLRVAQRKHNGVSLLADQLPL